MNRLIAYVVVLLVLYAPAAGAMQQVEFWYAWGGAIDATFRQL